MTDTIWRYFQHPETRVVQRIHASHTGHVELLLKYEWVEIEEPDDDS